MNKFKINYLHIILLNFMLLFTFYTTYAQDRDKSLKEISGKVTNLNAALADVNIIIKYQNRGTKTDALGNYTIKARVGDRIQYSYIGLKTVTITVEDVTKVLNVEIVTQINELEDVEVIADKKPGEVLDWQVVIPDKIKTSKGVYSPEASPYKYMDGRYIPSGSFSIADALKQRFPFNVKIDDTQEVFVRSRQSGNWQGPVVWDVDGSFFYREPALDLTQIKDIYIPFGDIILQLYYGPVIVVRTIEGSYEERKARKKEIAAQYTNKNYYKDDAVGSYSSYTKQDDETLKEISGKVTYLEKPLANTNVIIKGQNKGTKTNAQGNYIIQAKIGDFIQFRYMGYKTMTIVVEDVTSVINIEMIVEINELEETVVEGSTKKGRAWKQAKKKNKKFSTARGDIDPEKAGYAVGYFDGTNISYLYNNLTQALEGRISGYYILDGKPHFRRSDMPNGGPPAIYDIDGVIYTEEPPVDLTQIKDIHILKSLAATNRYGTIGGGGVIVVSMKYSSFDDVQEGSNGIAKKYTNKDYYNEDAVAAKTEILKTNPYYDTLTDLKLKQKAFDYYIKNLKTEVKDYSTYIGIAKIFKVYYKDLDLVSNILNDLAATFDKNPEILKAIAYQMQEYGLKIDAISMYERIFKLRPHYAQSYRDLANAYKENQQYNKAWKMYMSYLFQGNDVSGEGIGNILYNEMEWLYYNKNNQSSIKVQFEPKNKNIRDFRNDIRLVFEWNTSEAEFDLEFVNPKRQVYVFEHSLEKDQDLISDEKQKGYSSKEFIINDIKEFIDDDMKDGEWLVNLTYKGNKKPEPTYVKVTSYYNWGKPNQQEKISVYKFEKENEKIQLYRLDKRSLIVSN